MSSEAFTLPSFAKINLHLQVLGRRADGFHELCTVFQTVSLRDELTFSESGNIELFCDDPVIPVGDGNLIVKAAVMMRERFGVKNGVRFELKKQIPSPGGLGGGSSNAATALIGLNRLWDLNASMIELHEIGARLGADVPYFLCGGTAIGTGSGTEIEETTQINERYLIIVTPNVAISTRQAFERLRAPNLTNIDPESILRVCRFGADSLNLRRSALKNDFETTVFASFPEIRKAKQTLEDLGAVNALLSGSGASVFGIFEKEETRQTAMKALDEQVNWRKFAVATISRDEYRAPLGLV
ncbi:MAG: 4-(cytidine 5'-diphospho)-2-C-methyl-D-erythritol kinase [Blastocatellia bacterium]